MPPGLSLGSEAVAAGGVMVDVPGAAARVPAGFCQARWWLYAGIPAAVLRAS